MHQLSRTVVHHAGETLVFAERSPALVTVMVLVMPVIPMVSMVIVMTPALAMTFAVSVVVLGLSMVSLMALRLALGGSGFVASKDALGLISADGAPRVRERAAAPA